MDRQRRIQRTQLSSQCTIPRLVRRLLTAIALFALLPLTSGAAGDALSEGDRAFAAGDFAAALQAYRQAISAQPSSFDANLRAAQVALYANDLRDASAYLTAASALANAQQRTYINTLLQETQLRFTMRHAADAFHLPPDGVSIPMVAVDPLPLFMAQVDGHNAYFLLDTGAPNVVIDPAFARELGLRLRNPSTGTFAGGQHATVYQTTVPTFKLGPLTFHGVFAGALPTRRIPFFGDKRVDGVIGTIFLSQFLATVDYPHARLVLRPRTASGSFERSVAPAASFPFWYVPDHFLFARGTVNQLVDQTLLVDSGLAGGGFMPTQETVAAARIGLDAARAGQGVGGGGMVTVIPFTLDRLCLGAACQDDVPGSYTPGGTPFGIFPFKVSGVVSHEFLKRYAWSIDFDAMRMVLQ